MKKTPPGMGLRKRSVGCVGAWRHPFCPPRHVTKGGQRTRPYLPGEGAEDHTRQWYLEGVPSSPAPPPCLGERKAGLEEEFLTAQSSKDTEDQGDKGDGCQHNPQVGHSQVLGGGGPMVGEDTVQADK